MIFVGSEKPCPIHSEKLFLHDDVHLGRRKMSFIMPKEISAGEAPAPRNPRVGVSDVAEGETLAVREFPGVSS